MSNTIILVFFIMCINVFSADSSDSFIFLPEPEPGCEVSVEEAIRLRRSIRSYSEDSITLSELTRLLISAQGITSEGRFRAAPSAGALYPLSIIVIAENVDSLESGIYRFNPEDMTLLMLSPGNYFDDLSQACLGQSCVSSAAVIIAIIADYSITTDIYGDRGVMYVHMEAGHVSQNIYLQCTALGLGTVAVGAFHDIEVSEILCLKENETPLYLMPVGRP